MDELKLEAKTENLPQVLEFVDLALERLACMPRTQMQIDIAVEEIFVNIANYAYPNTLGTARILIEAETEPCAVSITFIDSGIPYDPLAKPDPDITLEAEKRSIGGLGIYMVKKSMDEVRYTYHEGQNQLTLRKLL